MIQAKVSICAFVFMKKRFLIRQSLVLKSQTEMVLFSVTPIPATAFVLDS